MSIEGENKSQLLDFTMRAGIILGLFWIFKYVFVIVGANNSIINAIGSLLSLGTPLLLFYLLNKYNTNITDNKLNYLEGVRFSILLFFFASILESLIVFIHIRWIDPYFISKHYNNMIELAETLELSKALIAQMSEQPLPNLFSYIFSNVFMTNVFLGLILSLIIVPFALRFKSQQYR